MFRKTNEFLNRTQELRAICDVQKEPFVQVLGYAGSGKSMLLKGIASYSQLKQGYNRVVFVELEQDDAPEDVLLRMSHEAKVDIGSGPGATSNEAGKYLARGLDRLVAGVRGTSALFVFDQIERSPLAVAWLEKELLPKLRHLWAERGGSGRVILAGRQGFAWQPVTRLNLFSLTLSPFHQETVEEMVRKYHLLVRQETLTPLERKRIAAAILRITGTGHAGFIKSVLDTIYGLSKERYPAAIDLVHYLDEHGNELIEMHLIPQMKKTILAASDPSVIRILEDVICVFRRMNGSILSGLRGKGLVSFQVDETWFDRSKELLRELEDMGILLRPGKHSPMYSLDPVVGFLLASWLQRRHPELYRKASEVAYTIFDESMQTAGSAFQLAYASEALYHTQCLRVIGGSKRELREEARCYLRRLADADSQALAMQWHDVTLSDTDLWTKIREEAYMMAAGMNSEDERLAEVYIALSTVFEEFKTP